PFRGRQLTSQQLGSVFLDEDFRLKIKAGGEAEILVRGPSKTVRAPMFASAIRIDAGVEADVGAIVVGDDGAGVVGEKLRGGGGGFVGWCVGVALVVKEGEAVGGVVGGAAATGRFRFGHGRLGERIRRFHPATMPATPSLCQAR